MSFMNVLAISQTSYLLANLADSRPYTREPLEHAAFSVSSPLPHDPPPRQFYILYFHEITTRGVCASWELPPCIVCNKRIYKTSHNYYALVLFRKLFQKSILSYRNLGNVFTINRLCKYPGIKIYCRNKICSKLIKEQKFVIVIFHKLVLHTFLIRISPFLMPRNWKMTRNFH